MSGSNYEKIIRANLEKVFGGEVDRLSETLPARLEDRGYIFKAFGETCRLEPSGLFLNGRPETGPKGIIITLYALSDSRESPILEPFRAFKEFPDSMPYAGAFVTHTENILIPHAESMRKQKDLIIDGLDGSSAPAGTGGDTAFIVKPLPKITLCYILYEADEDFPASITCLYSNNAIQFLPIDGLADVGEYTSRKIIELLK